MRALAYMDKSFIPFTEQLQDDGIDRIRARRKFERVEPIQFGVTNKLGGACASTRHVQCTRAYRY